MERRGTAGGGVRVGSAPEGGREPGMSGEEEGGGMLLEMEALAEENEQLKARMEALEARNSQLQVALEEGRGSPHRAASTFYNNSDDIARLLDQVAELRSTSREQKQRIASLTRENDQLRAGFRLARAVGSPSRHPSRNPAGRRFDDRDVVISRLEAQVLSLEDALKVYRDAAADRERRRQVRRRHEAEERRELAGPVDLTVAWP